MPSSFSAARTLGGGQAGRLGQRADVDARIPVEQFADQLGVVGDLVAGQGGQDAALAGETPGRLR
ncbi:MULTISPECIES: hypothetical protein [unclassified Micromonospora]|uniref:hypothetical protein n=1 Tax=unclassified Micromonospora TaxID=2617518 RepID=UPI003A8807A1